MLLAVPGFRPRGKEHSIGDEGAEDEPDPNYVALGDSYSSGEGNPPFQS
ncbi:hypothetical protein ACHZ98_30580 [Streptomyces sp. MAR4 CNY-716]